MSSLRVWLLWAALSLPVAVAAQDTTRTQPARAAPRDTVRLRGDTVTVVPANPRADTLPVLGDTARQRPDTARRPPPAPPRAPFDSLYGDSVRAPFARAESPALVSVGPPLRWDRVALFASGALTLDDLLQHVSGATTFTTGWLVAPHLAGFGGDFSRFRVFYDGVEIDRMDPRFPEGLDLAAIPLWSLESVTLERVAGEVRVHLQSWRAEHTTPRTRTDIFTGDRQTELFRGLFGQRYRSGAGLQLGGQSLSTVDNRFGGGGDQQTYLARGGWARGRWSIDLYGYREQRQRSETLRLVGTGGNMRPRGTRSTFGYVRVAFTGARTWAQLLASGAGNAELDALNDSTPGERSRRTQYVAAAGLETALLRASITQRLRVFNGEIAGATVLRTSVERGLLSVAAHAERDGADSAQRVDLTGRLAPFDRLSVLGSIGRRSYRDARPDGTDVIGEVGVRLRGTLWLGAGITTRDSSVLRAPRIFDSLLVDTSAARATATFVTMRGRIWRDVYADVRGTRWSDSAFYRPLYDARAELGIRTRWLRRFPSGSFGLLASVAQEYRSGVLFPVADSAINSGASRAVNTLLEIRILSAVLTWQYRNPFGAYNQQVPGFLLPRRQNFYGVRWDWYN